MKNIGLEIKILRERNRMSGKELAQTIGLSQSQMSRLEKGQRRIDTKILHLIASALGVKPSYFFGEQEDEEKALNLRKTEIEIGKIIRRRRHERHFTPEELAKKVHKTKSYIQEIENGKAELLTNELIARICKVLKIDPLVFFEVQQNSINDMKTQLLQMTKRRSDLVSIGAVTPGSRSDENVQLQPVPVFATIENNYPADFTNTGLPLAEVEDQLFLGGLSGEQAFAVRCVGDSMVQPQAPSFAGGDILVFTSIQPVETRDFVFVRIIGQPPVFRQVFFDPDNRLRLQPLNRNYPPVFLTREEVLQWFKLVAHITRY